MDLLGFIRRFEGFSPRAYWDNKQYSIGYGTRANGPDETITRTAAEARLEQEVGKARDFVDRFAPNAPEGVKQALTSLTYNAGTKWANAGLGQAVRNGQYDTAREILQEYNKAGGTVNPGLVSRRAQEASLFDKPLQSQPIQVAQLNPPQQSIWDNRAPFQPSPDQFSSQPPHSAWDSVPGINNGTPATVADLVPQPNTLFGSAEPNDIYNTLAPQGPSLAQFGGITPAQAALPPPNQPLGQGTPFADRFNPPTAQAPDNYAPSSLFDTAKAPANPFDQLTQGPEALQPWQVASANPNPLSGPAIPLPQITVTPPKPSIIPAAPKIAAPPPPQIPSPQIPPQPPSFAQSVYSTNPSGGPITTAQDFNAQEAAIKQGFAPWAPQLGGTPQAGGLLGSMQNGGMLGKLLSSINPLPIANSSNLSNSIALGNSFNPSVPATGPDAIKMATVNSTTDPAMLQNGNLLDTLFGSSPLAMNGGLFGQPQMLDGMLGILPNLMPLPDFGMGDAVAMSPASLDFGFMG